MNFMEENKQLLTNIALVLAIIGSINWGLTVFSFNLVALLGPIQFPVYIIVGVAGVYLILVYNDLMAKINEDSKKSKNSGDEG